MTKPKKKIDPSRDIVNALSPSSGFDADALRTFFDLVSRTDHDRPDPIDLLKLEDLLIANPGIWRGVADLAVRGINLMIDQINPSPSVRLSLRRGADELRAELAGVGASPLESVLAEQISVCWVRLRIFEVWHISAAAEGDPVLIKFWEARVTSAQHRFLAACESLARIRRLAARTPQLLQINVGGQQVNVARTAGQDPPLTLDAEPEP